MTDSDGGADAPPQTRRAAREAAAESATATPAEGTEQPAAKGSGGIAAMVRKHPTAWLAGALAAAFLLLGTGAVFAGLASGSKEPVAAVVPTPTATQEPPRPIPEALPAASQVRTCSVDKAATDSRLAKFYGQVVNAKTGEVLFDRLGTTPARTGSVLKILTAAAALSVLGPSHQLSTRVVAGSVPGTVVLVGGGDATLSALTSGESYYPGAPKLSDLAQQVMKKRADLGVTDPITEVVLDASMWSTVDKWDPAWKRSEQTIGYHSEVTALQVDGDRADPRRGTSPRSTDPIARAGDAFVSALAAAGNTGDVDNGGAVNIVANGVAASSTVLAEVKSQPVSALIQQMLLVSDNTLAEMLARVTSKVTGLDGSADSLQRAIPGALDLYGINTSDLTIKDGSGLSEFNAVPPSYLAELMVKIIGGKQNLNVLYDGLPVAGVSGSLASRFTGANAAARGNVIAKTGWIDTAYSLGGVVNAKDGTRLTFAFYAVGSNVRDSAKEALDTLTAAVYSCGDNLSNN